MVPTDFIDALATNPILTADAHLHFITLFALFLYFFSIKALLVAFNMPKILCQTHVHYKSQYIAHI